MKKRDKKSRVRAGFWILLTVVMLPFLAVLELSKNTLLGWAVALSATALYIVLEIKVIKKRKTGVRCLAWLGFFAVLAVAVLISQPPTRCVPAVDTKHPETTAVITVAQGDLTGVYTEDKDVEVYAGIPYAKPPVGELRWKEPQEPDSWEGVRACDTFAPMSMQVRNSELMNSLTSIVGYRNYRISLRDNYREAVSEDSLYLNVWKPAGEVTDAAVLVFIHGGSLTSGQPSFSEYRGEDLAKKGIIVVNFGYRLNVFGYMANEALAAESPNGTTGNYGLLDQVAALRWVQQNIAAFGGDPAKVTVAGESAGSSSVNALCVSPLAKGLFRYAIGESSGITPITPYHTFRDLQSALAQGEQTLSEFDAESIEELRSIPAEELVKTTANNSAMTVDGYAITEQPYLIYLKGENNEQALLNGYNSHEANVFSLFNKVEKEDYESTLAQLFGDNADEAIAAFPYDSVPLDYDFLVEAGGAAKGTYNYILGGTWFAYSHKKWSDYVADEGRPVYFYCFDKDNRSLRANHGGEMPYAYGNLWRHAWLYDETDEALSDVMQTYWVNFVNTGDPNGDSVPVWQPYAADRSQVLLLDEQIAMQEDTYLKLYALLDRAQQQTALSEEAA
ncbi:MAG: carboxylesterase family protein [Eubacterium sp.]|nr:carboxylesterase family protein [Eubacterium sp.]